MSRLDDFMSQILDLTETEKEEVIRFLASALCHELEVTAKPSKKVMLILIPFMANIMVDQLKKDL